MEMRQTGGWLHKQVHGRLFFGDWCAAVGELMLIHLDVPCRLTLFKGIHVFQRPVPATHLPLGRVFCL